MSYAVLLLETPAKYIIDITTKIEDGTAFKDKGYHKDIVLIVPTNETHSEWFQQASALSIFFCDSDQFPVRLLYYGENGFEYYKELFKYGISSAFIHLEQQQQLSGSKPRQITASAFTMPRTGNKAPKKAPTAEELLKRIKTKKAAKKAPKK